MADGGRVAMLETRTDGSGDGEPQQMWRYQYADHLGSASLELDGDGSVITYEEYYPFGSTSFQSGRSPGGASLKRYRYTGKERDEETGLNYHGARYYAPWLGRWCAVDPKESEYAPWSSYNYAFDNPVKWTDSTGKGPEKVVAVTGPDKQPAVAGAIGEVEVRAKRPQTLDGPPSPSRQAAAAQLSLQKYQTEHADEIAQEKEREAYYNQRHDVLDRFGTIHMGTRRETEAAERRAEQNYTNQVGANIAGGFFGALGYVLLGDKGSFLGAGVDQAAAAGVALRARTATRSPDPVPKPHQIEMRQRLKLFVLLSVVEALLFTTTRLLLERRRWRRTIHLMMVH